MRTTESGDIRVLFIDDDGPLIATANDVIGDAWSENASLIVMPASRLEKSQALRDFVGESNRGTQVWFLADEAALADRLAPARVAAWTSSSTSSAGPA